LTDVVCGCPVAGRFRVVPVPVCLAEVPRVSSTDSRLRRLHALHILDCRLLQRHDSSTHVQAVRTSTFLIALLTGHS